MEPFIALTDLYAKGSLVKVAYSALPDAPVQPYVAPRHRVRRIVAAVRNSARRPARAASRGAYTPRQV